MPRNPDRVAASRRGDLPADVAWFARRYWKLLTVLAIVVIGTVSWRIVSGPDEVDWMPPDADSDDWYAVCQGTAFTRAAPYAGPGPHPVKIFGGPGAGKGAELDRDKPPASWDPQRADQVQLVACAEVIDTENTGRDCPRFVNRFPFDLDGTGPELDGYVALYTARYEVSLYEARTGEKVDSWEITGDDGSCPDSASGVVLHSGILPSQWKRLLAGHVEKDVD